VHLFKKAAFQQETLWVILAGLLFAVAMIVYLFVSAKKLLAGVDI